MELAASSALRGMDDARKLPGSPCTCRTDATLLGGGIIVAGFDGCVDHIDKVRAVGKAAMGRIVAKIDQRHMDGS